MNEKQYKLDSRDFRFGLWPLVSGFRRSVQTFLDSSQRPRIKSRRPKTKGQRPKPQLKIGNGRGPLQSNFARYAYEGDFGHLFERGERYAGSETNHSEPYQWRKCLVSGYKNWRLGGTRIWLLAFGHESTVFTPWPRLPGLSELWSAASVQSRKLANEGKSLL